MDNYELLFEILDSLGGHAFYRDKYGNVIKLWIDDNGRSFITNDSELPPISFQDADAILVNRYGKTFRIVFDSKSRGYKELYKDGFPKVFYKQTEE